MEVSAIRRGLFLPKSRGTDAHKALIELLVAKREAAGLTQAELAKRLGEYQSFVARLESGQRRVDLIEFIELSEAIGFDAVKGLSAIRERYRRQS